MWVPDRRGGGGGGVGGGGAMVLGALIAHLLRCESPGVTCDLLQDAAHGAMCLPAAQLISQLNDGMVELLVCLQALTNDEFSKDPCAGHIWHWASCRGAHE